MITVSRECPPLTHSLSVLTPLGRRARWATDEPAAADVPNGLRHSDTMPGGYENLDATLPRDPAQDYPDLDRLSTIQVRNVGGDIVGEYRLERAPLVSGDQFAISPSAVGWQAHLDDDKSVTFLGIDRTLSTWTGPSYIRQTGLTGFNPNTGPDTAVDPSNGQPSLMFAVDGPAGTAGQSEGMYDAGPGNLVGRVIFAGAPLNFGTAAAVLTQMSASSTTIPTDSVSADTDGAAVALATYTLTTPRRYLHYIFRFTTALASDVMRRYYLQNLAVIGNHGLTLYGNSGAEGLLASDIVKYGVSRWAPMLTYTSETVEPSDFAIPQFTLTDPSTLAELIRQATRFDLQDWAVWANRTFYWHTRGLFSRNWRARAAPSVLEETGPQIDRVWESILVQFQDVDGTTRTVGPPGSGADAESSDLKDTDPDNPANQLGIVRRDLLSMGTGTVSSAIAVGRRFLREAKKLDTSGRAQITGYIQDDHGAIFPYSSIRSGDTITFVDAADPSPRRIVRSDKDHAARTCRVDLDAPPEGLNALLERLGVVLVPLGL